jgi:hypothetical protein
MSVSNFVLDAVQAAMGTDTTTFDKALWMFLIKAPFTDNPATVIADGDLASFDGSAPIARTAAALLAGVDPLTGDRISVVKPTTGSWTWATTGLTNLPQTIYGFGLGDSSVTLGGSHRMLLGQFEAPIPLAALVGQVINVDNPIVRITAPAITVDPNS